MKPLPGPARPVAASAALALAGHAALLALALWAPESGTPAGGGAPADRLIRVSLRPAPAAAAETPAQPLPPEDDARATSSAAGVVAETAPMQAQADAAGATPSAAAPPSFVAPPAARGMPDATLPDGGVRVNLLVRAGPDGQPADIAMAVWPPEADAAYAHWAERSLSEARLAPGSPGPHCLQLSFEPGRDEPRWAWWPLDGAAGDRCLSGRLPGVTRPLPAR